MSEQIPSRACVEKALEFADRLHDLASRVLRIEGRHPYLRMTRSERIELDAILEAQRATLGVNKILEDQRTNFRSWQTELGSHVNWYTQGWPPEVERYLKELTYIEYNVTCRVDPIVHHAADDPDWRPPEYDMTQDEFALLDLARTHLRNALNLSGIPLPPTPPSEVNYEAIYVALIDTDNIKSARLIRFMEKRLVANHKEILDGVYDGSERPWDTVKTLVNRTNNALVSLKGDVRVMSGRIKFKTGNYNVIKTLKPQ